MHAADIRASRGRLHSARTTTSFCLAVLMCPCILLEGMAWMRVCRTEHDGHSAGKAKAHNWQSRARKLTCDLDDGGLLSSISNVHHTSAHALQDWCHPSTGCCMSPHSEQQLSCPAQKLQVKPSTHVWLVQRVCRSRVSPAR